MRITNGGAGPRGIQTTGGVVYLEPGQTEELEVSDAEAPGIFAHPDLVVDAPDAEAPVKTSRKPRA